jgi:lipocalin
MTEQVLECLQCGKPLKSGRIDKKFCNEGCRNAYHNAQKIADNTEIKNINQALKDNRKILKKILGDKPSETVSHEALLKSGFEFEYHTHYVMSHFQNNEYTFCYNYGYRLLENNKYKVIKSFK